MPRHKEKTLIGSRIPRGTSGSILFIDANGRIAQNNPQLFWDNVNNRLGIGTTAPTGRLHIHDTSTENQAITMRAFGTNIGTNWAGRIVSGGINVAFIMGEYNAMAWLGAHNAAMDAWSDFYINPDGTMRLYLGGVGGFLGGPAMTVNNANGNVGIGTTTPTARLDINSNILRLRTANTLASATAAGNVGDICWDANFVYVCVAVNSWRRAGLTAW